MAINPLKIGGGALYLATYAMEAVGFTEFIYEEAVQQGIGVLKSMVAKKQYGDLIYMLHKFEDNVFYPGYHFHISYGPMNPFTYPGFHVFYQKAQEKINELIFAPRV